jgi:hypothetical protein
MEGWDPCGAQIAEQEIWAGFASEAGVTLEELHLAYTRVTLDGYYGPISDEDWAEQDGRPMPLKKAIAILHSALEHDPMVKYISPEIGWCCDGAEHCDHPDHKELDEDGPLFHGSEVVVLPEAIKRECFPSLIEIYGRLL